MNRDQALGLLELGPDTSLAAAEVAYQQQRMDLLDLLEAASLKATARSQLNGRLARLEEAIEALRGLEEPAPEDLTRIFEDDLTVIQGAPDTPDLPPEDDPDATRFAWVDEVSPTPNQTTVQPFLSSPEPAPVQAAAQAAGGGRRLLLPVLALAVGLVLLAAWFLLPRGGEDGEPPVAAGEPPRPTAPTGGNEPAVPEVSADWELWRSRLEEKVAGLTDVLEAAREESLAAAATIDSRTTGGADDHPARERLALVERYIVDRDYLATVERRLARPLPTTDGAIKRQWMEMEQLTADAQARLDRLGALDAALAERQSTRAQLARLRAAGLPRWPPAPDEFAVWFEDSEPAEVARAVAATRSADAAFSEADFRLAAQRYKRSAARLSRLDVTRVETAADTDERIAELFALGREAIERNRLSLPADASALYYALEIETLQPGRPEAAELMTGIQQRYIALANGQLARGQGAKAKRYADMAVAMGAEESDVAAIRRRADGLLERQFQPGDRVVEAEDLEMVALPLGEFTMGARSSALEDFAGNIGELLGSLFGNDDRDYSGGETEVPPHRVAISSPVAISRSEITVEQFRRFIDSSGYRTDAELHGYTNALLDDREVRMSGKNWRHNYLGKPAAGDEPVINVSQRDARAYARWLSSVTGASYRLPSESEFEYAARAGTTRLLPWSGGTPPPDSGNFRGQQDTPPTGWRTAPNLRAVPRYADGYFGPAPVASFGSNAFGYADLLGNVSEWVDDCFQSDYTGKGPSQTARREGNCDFGVVRDTAWSDDARLLRLSYRQRRASSYSSNTVGFRVARDLRGGSGGR